MKHKHVAKPVLLKALLYLPLIAAVLFSINACSVRRSQNESIDTSSTNTNVAVPQKAQSYIKNNYPEYNIVRASDDPMCTGEPAIDVSIKKDRSVISLIFSPTGDFLQSEVDVDYSEAPQGIGSKIKSEFPGYAASEQIEKLTLPNGETQYLVDIVKDEDSKEVIFDTGANVVCIH